ncbi:putative histone lysine methyltransferase, SET [Besnoitia besnoiti]|uniref:Putative histone lysine methyltransferase, SET n=1 Tax=Besnoitia besnoiti TaxID=94643 RepID=A0A2A9MMT9_BESBE|nr:putative histone lysine methyltransferase, SET [Besnoitia besnoiti]PFH37456.1 putative histone lysine methyltransferase, SET [Besnoitia besnoiti]
MCDCLSSGTTPQEGEASSCQPTDLTQGGAAARWHGGLGNEVNHRPLSDSPRSDEQDSAHGPLRQGKTEDGNTAQLPVQENSPLPFQSESPGTDWFIHPLLLPLLPSRFVFKNPSWPPTPKKKRNLAAGCSGGVVPSAGARCGAVHTASFAHESSRSSIHPSPEPRRGLQDASPGRACVAPPGDPRNAGSKAPRNPSTVISSRKRRKTLLKPKGQVPDEYSPGLCSNPVAPVHPSPLPVSGCLTEHQDDASTEKATPPTEPVACESMPAQGSRATSPVRSGTSLCQGGPQRPSNVTDECSFWQAGSPATSSKGPHPHAPADGTDRSSVAPGSCEKSLGSSAKPPASVSPALCSDAGMRIKGEAAEFQTQGTDDSCRSSPFQQSCASLARHPVSRPQAAHLATERVSSQVGEDSCSVRRAATLGGRRGVEASSRASPSQLSESTVKPVFLPSIGCGLTVSASSLGRGSGLGVYSCRAYAARSRIGEYAGVCVDRKVAMMLRGMGTSTHVMRVGMQYQYLVGYRLPFVFGGAGAFVNDGRWFADGRKGPGVTARFHVVYDKKRAKDRVYVVATRDIAQGEEIFTSYDNQYWALLQ